MLIATRKCKKIWDDENLQQETLGAHQWKEAAGLGCPLGLLRVTPELRAPSEEGRILNLSKTRGGPQVPHRRKGLVLFRLGDAKV